MCEFDINSVEDIYPAYLTTIGTNLRLGIDIKPEGYVFDEEQSVKWNKEKLIEHNTQMRKLLEERRQKQNQIREAFEVAVYEFIGKELHTNPRVGKAVLQCVQHQYDEWDDITRVLDTIIDVHNILCEEDTYND